MIPVIPQTLACKYLEKLSNNQVFLFDFVYSLSLYILLMQGDCTMATDRLIPWRDASWFEPQWMLKNAFKTSLDFFFPGVFRGVCSFTDYLYMLEFLGLQGIDGILGEKRCWNMCFLGSSCPGWLCSGNGSSMKLRCESWAETSWPWLFVFFVGGSYYPVV